MLTFEMNAGNFDTYLGGGAADGTRVTADGVELDLGEHAPDGDTLALYHLHDEDLADHGAGGYDLSPEDSPSWGDDGLECASTGVMGARTSGPVLSLNGVTDGCVEFWARWSLSDIDEGRAAYPFYWAKDSSNRIFVSLRKDSGNVQVRGLVVAGGNTIGNTGYATLSADQWAALKAGMTHVALVFHLAAAGACWSKLYLGGVLLQTKTDNNAAFDDVSGTIFVGYPYYDEGDATKTWDGTLDEVRISRALRYPAGFEPKRHVAAGTFTSPAFDTGRLACDWLPLAWQAEVPATAALVMHVRTSDELDGGGQVTGQWQAAEAAPDDARYLQWRAALTRGTDAPGLLTPTVESVTAVASQAGCNLYAGVGKDAWAIDYAAPVARLGPGAVSHSVGGLAYPAVHWFGVRSSNADGLESKTIDAEVRLELDADGQEVPARPAPVESLEAAGAGGGTVRLQWLALAEAGQAAPDVFCVYSNGGSGEVDFNTPLGEVAHVEGLRQYEWTSDAFDDGLTVTFAVRAETDAGGVDADPPEIEIEIDAAPPAAVGFLAAAPSLDD